LEVLLNLVNKAATIIIQETYEKYSISARPRNKHR